MIIVSTLKVGSLYDADIVHEHGLHGKNCMERRSYVMNFVVVVLQYKTQIEQLYMNSGEEMGVLMVKS